MPGVSLVEAWASLLSLLRLLAATASPSLHRLTVLTFQGTAFRDVKGSNLKLFPTIGLKRNGEHIRVNFGQTPFVFDIDGLMKACTSLSLVIFLIFALSLFYFASTHPPPPLPPIAAVGTSSRVDS